MTANTGRQNQETLPRGRESLQTFREWKDTMKTSINQARNFRPATGRIVTALAVASVMGAISMTPALARDNDNRQGHRDKGWHKGQSQGERNRREYRPVYQQPYYYSQPVYAPPPVYYTPQQSPGISLFFPLDFRR